MDKRAVRRKYNILFLEHGVKPLGGGQVNTLSLIKGLDKDLFTPFIVSTQENAFTSEARACGVHVEVISFPKKIASLGRNSVKYDPYHLVYYCWHVVVLLKRLIRYININQIDLLHPGDNIMRIVGGIAAKITRRPAVCQIMDDFEVNTTSRILRTIILNTMDYVLPVSDKAASFFRKSGKNNEKVITVYTGIDLGYYNCSMPDSGLCEEFGIKDGVLVIGIVGRLIQLKGHRELFEALAILKQEGVSVFCCLVVGDGPELNSLKDLAFELGIASEVIFTGFVKSVPAVMKCMDILVAPSHTEASSRVVLEAGAMQIPVIATKVGGIPEMIVENKTGILVPLGDIQALSRAIKVLFDENLRKEMGIAASDRIKSLFCNKVTTTQIEDIYLKAIRE
ncbi:MAG: glycosyltransferase family 4 protein [Candidatus Omnitrophota bacterium]